VVMYLDDVTVVLLMCSMIWTLEAKSLNTSKCEIICHGETVQGNLIVALRGAKIVSPDKPVRRQNRMMFVIP